VKVVGPGESDLPGFVSVGATTVIPANGAKTPIALAPGAGRAVLSALVDVDVAHVHEPLMPQVSLTVLRRAAMPLVGTFHSDVSPVGAGVYRFGKPITSRWFRRLAVMTAVSTVAARVVEYTHRVRIIPNGIDVADYAPSAKVANSVIFLGRNDERKGLHVLLDAWPNIRAARPEATLTVVGAERVGPARPGVTFVGRVPEAEKINRLAQSAVYCAPNLSGESFGIVVAEAMAAGCAVVASALPGFVSVAGNAARFVAPGDAAGLADAVSGLLGAPREVAALSHAARARVQRFDGSVVAAAYLSAYEEAIAG
jgi:phosphatidylinositol alpha-mannosyltransferase